MKDKYKTLFGELIGSPSYVRVDHTHPVLNTIPEQEWLEFLLYRVLDQRVKREVKTSMVVDLYKLMLVKKVSLTHDWSSG